MLLFLSAFFSGAIFIAFFVSAETGILLAIIGHPIISTTYGQHFSGVSFLRVLSVLFVLFVLAHAMRRPKTIINMPLSGIWTVYAIYGVLASLMALEQGFLKYTENTFRILNGFVGFYMLQTYFSDKASFRKLLFAFLLAGLFPLTVAMYQLLTGTAVLTGQERVSMGFLRNVGFYHDAMVLKYYCFQTTAAIILYWSYFVKKRGDTTIKLLLIAYAIITAVALFRLYTKAGYLAAAVWAAIWFLSRKQYKIVAAIVVGFLILNMITQDRLIEDATQVFGKEITAAEGNAVGDLARERAFMHTFSGRWYRWFELIDEYADSSFIRQLIGRGYGAAAHNDYLNRLMSNGAIGLLLYLCLLAAIGTKVTKNYLRARTPLNVMAVMLFAMWMIDTIGLAPSFYIDYQWYTWGLIGLSFKGINWGSTADIGRRGRGVRRGSASVRRGSQLTGSIVN